jgi:hypothetical protein
VTALSVFFYTLFLCANGLVGLVGFGTD